LIEDFGHRSLHLTTQRAKEVVAAFYGAPPRYAYYTGCSKGGQQGLMEAQRYPGDYDGIVAGNPANDWTRFYAGGHLWYAQALLADPESFLPPAKVAHLGAAVDAACDALDGIEDGVIDDPRRCDLDLRSLLCPAGEDGDTCLTEKQAAAVERIWAGASTPAGELVYPGLVPGGEAARGGWTTWVTGPAPFQSLHFLAADGFFKNFVFDDPDWDFRTFDWNRDVDRSLTKVGAALDAADPDLRPLEEKGAKLIVYHGWSDPDISPLASIDYYESVVGALTKNDDRSAALARTREFFRLFLVPGMGHCRGGPGTDRFDALAALERWVEEGEAPARIVAAKQVEGATVRTRPLCPYPEVAAWNGVGDRDDAASFACVAPR
ncbi:MAG: tannase/feruloyl esterase family alpha/beta hydrolase, partial [Thermoanaerobaculia bacterium]|nr:tannase/feruloyl esterase family alpha/beta hydrolase [Thermoanaerobaculia bacterium]